MQRLSFTFLFDEAVEKLSSMVWRLAIMCVLSIVMPAADRVLANDAAARCMSLLSLRTQF